MLLRAVPSGLLHIAELRTKRKGETREEDFGVPGRSGALREEVAERFRMQALQSTSDPALGVTRSSTPAGSAVRRVRLGSPSDATRAQGQ